LSAYRRDDWLPEELESLGQHLAGCADCRRVEASYRQVGEGIRQLPSITPPPSLREAVFAAIRDDEARRERSLEEITSDQTYPRLPIVQPLRREGGRPRRKVVLGTRAAIVVAAALLISLFGARLLPALAQGFPNLTDYLFGPFGWAPSVPYIQQYRIPASAGRVTEAMASAHWVVYVASDRNGHAMLYAMERSSGRTVGVLAGPLDRPVTLRAVSDHWIVWQTGDGTSQGHWALQASPVPTSSSAETAQANTLASDDSDAPDAPAMLSGVWADDSTVLVAEMTHAGDGVVVRLDLASGQSAPAARTIARAQVSGHLLTDPSEQGGMYYWAEVWSDGASGLHSDIWTAGEGEQARQVTTSGEAFAPRTTAQSLIWVQPSRPVQLDANVVTSQPAQAAETALERLGGSIQTQGLRGGPSHQVAAHGSAQSVEVAGHIVVWQNGGQLHTYDLMRQGASQVESQVRSAGYVGASGAALAWGASGASTIEVYDTH
jgi:hypothetical protein